MGKARPTVATRVIDQPARERVMAKIESLSATITEAPDLWIVELGPDGLSSRRTAYKETAAEALAFVLAHDQRLALRGRSVARTITWETTTRIGKQVVRALTQVAAISRRARKAGL